MESEFAGEQLLNTDYGSVDELVACCYDKDRLTMGENIRFLLKDYLARHINAAKMRITDPEAKVEFDRLLERFLGY